MEYPLVTKAGHQFVSARGVRGEYHVEARVGGLDDVSLEGIYDCHGCCFGNLNTSSRGQSTHNSISESYLYCNWQWSNLGHFLCSIIVGLIPTQPGQLLEVIFKWLDAAIRSRTIGVEGPKCGTQLIEIDWLRTNESIKSCPLFAISESPKRKRPQQQRRSKCIIQKGMLRRKFWVFECSNDSQGEILNQSAYRTNGTPYQRPYLSPFSSWALVLYERPRKQKGTIEMCIMKFKLTVRSESSNGLLNLGKRSGMSYCTCILDE